MRLLKFFKLFILWNIANIKIRKDQMV